MGSPDRPFQRGSPAKSHPPRGASDGDLLSRTAQGDRLAFQLLHRRHEAYFFWLALRLLGDVADAEDVVQEAWLKVFTKAKGASGGDGVRGWLRSIVIRCCLDHRRRRRRRTPPRAVRTSREAAGEIPRPGLRLDLERAVLGLPWDLRAVVVLHDIEGMAHAEIGGLLHLTEEASRARLSRARRELRRRLGKP